MMDTHTLRATPGQSHPPPLVLTTAHTGGSSLESDHDDACGSEVQKYE